MQKFLNIENMISSLKIQINSPKTRFWKEKSVQDLVTLGPPAQATLVYVIFKNVENFKSIYIYIYYFILILQIFFCGRKIKNMMKYLGIHHLSKWNPQN